MEYTGRVVIKLFAVGTKSERDAVMLVTENHEYVLRRLNGNPIYDPALAELANQRIRCEGTVHGYTLIITNWHVLDAKD